MCLYGDGTKIDNIKREIAIILGKSLELANRSYWNNTFKSTKLADRHCCSCAVARKIILQDAFPWLFRRRKI